MRLAGCLRVDLVLLQGCRRTTHANLLTQEVANHRLLMTLGRLPRPHIVREVTPTAGVPGDGWVEATRVASQSVPAWMLNLAWGYLRVHGRLSSRYLLDELRAHRSSAMCALLTRHPQLQNTIAQVVCLPWSGPEGGG